MCGQSGPRPPTVQGPTVRTSGTHRQLLSYINHHHHRCTGGSSKWYSFRSKLLMPNVSSSSYHLIIILSSYSVSLSCRVGSGSLILMVATHIQPALLLHYSAPPLHCLNITIPMLLHCSKLHNAIPQYCNTNIQSASNYTAPSLPLYHSTIAQYKCPQIYNTFPRYQVSQYPLYHKVLKCAISQIPKL